jgi:hypothetical protein
MFKMCSSILHCPPSFSHQLITTCSYFYANSNVVMGETIHIGKSNLIIYNHRTNALHDFLHGWVGTLGV